MSPTPTAPLPASSRPALPLVRRVLANGLTVLVLENPVADIVAARVFLRAGSSLETAQNAGLTSLMMGLLTKGTETLSSLAIAEQVESVGASLGTDASADYSVVSLKAVSADFPDLLALAGDLLRRPSFPAAELDLEQRLTLQQLRSMQEQPFTVAFHQFLAHLYGDHPYGRSGMGTAESVATLERDQLVAFHRQTVRPDSLVVTVVGHIEAERAIALVEDVFGDWPCPEGAPPVPTFPAALPAPAAAITPQATNQSIVMTGYVAPAVDDLDYAALKLINTYLGNGLSSRLFVELREKRGLAYDVSAFYPTRLAPSQFVAYMGTSPDNTALALDSLSQELERLGQVPLLADELQAAKNKLLGQYALGKQTNAQLAQILGWYEVLGLGVDFDQTFQDAAAAVTVEDVQRVAQRWFTQPQVSLLGPEAAVAPLAGQA